MGLDTDETQQASDAVARRTRRGISWNIVGAAVTNVMRLVSVVVLGRLLAPEDFGVVAAALSVMLVLHQLRDVGIGAALIQRERLERAHIAAAFTISLYIGLALGVLLTVIAPLIGDLYNIPRSVDLIRALGILFVLRGISTVPVMMCRRSMNFRAIAIIDAVTYIAGISTAIVLALGGAGPWSLIAGYVVEESLSAIAYVYLQKPPFTLRIDRVRLRELLGFGVGHTIIQVANILAIHGDNFVVGRTLGATELGLYTRAYELIKLPAAVFTNVVGNVLFPAFSRLQHDREQLATGFRRATVATGVVLLPASAVLIVLAPEAIRVVMGDQWSSAVVPFQILATTMMMRTSYKVGATIAMAAGRVYAVAVANIVYMLCVIIGAAISIRWGIPGVATSTAIAIFVIYIACCWLAMQVSALTVASVVGAHVPGFAIALGVGAAIWTLAIPVREANLGAPAIFALLGFAGMLLTLAAIAIWMRLGSDDGTWLRGELVRLVRRGKKKTARREQ